MVAAACDHACGRAAVPLHTRRGVGPRLANHRVGPVALHRGGGRVHHVFVLHARAAVAHPAECRDPVQRRDGLLGQFAGLPGQQLSSGAGRRADPEPLHQQPFHPEQDVRAHYSAGGAPDGCHRPGAVELAGPAGRQSEAALDGRSFPNHGHPGWRGRGRSHGVAAHRGLAREPGAAHSSSGAHPKCPASPGGADPAKVSAPSTTGGVLPDSSA